MAKISKQDRKEQERIFKILEKDVLTEDEKWDVISNINIAYIDNLSTSAYFTPAELSARFCSYVSSTW